MKHILFLLIGSFFCIQTQAQGNVIIDNRPYTVDTLSRYSVGPGSIYTQLQFKDATYPLDVFFLEIDASNPHIKFKAVTSNDSIRGWERPSKMALRKSNANESYFAGTNADFYNTTNGVPINGFVTNGQIGQAPIPSRVAVAFTPENFPVMNKMTFNGSLKNSNEASIAISNVNVDRGENQLILYNPIYGKYTRTNDFGTEVLISVENNNWRVNDTTIVATVEEINQNKGNQLIPSNKAILSGHGIAKDYLNQLNIGDKLSLDLSILISSQPELTRPITELVGGDKIIASEGAYDPAGAWDERHPRTSIGYSQDRQKIYFCVVDGRTKTSAGVTTKQLAELMINAGAYEALNLDGGGSSCMYIKEHGQVNYPSDGSERAVADAVFAVSTAPEDSLISKLAFEQYKINIPAYSRVKPSIVGYNQYDLLINKNVAVQFSCSSDLGHIDNEGYFIASGTASEGLLTAEYRGITQSAKITINRNATNAFRLNSIVIDNRTKYKIEVESKTAEGIHTIDPLALNWSVEDSLVCKVEAGVLHGLRNGETRVIGEIGTFKDTLNVKVEIIENSSLEVELFDNPSSFKTSQNGNLKSLTFDNSNLPETWTNGATVAYTYSKGSFSFFSLKKKLSIYSLPDTIKISMNTGNIPLSEVFVYLKASNEKSARSISFKNLEVGRDIVLTIAPSLIFPLHEDISTYPISLEQIEFYLKDTEHVANSGYKMHLKEIRVVNDVKNDVGVHESNELKPTIAIYPNPIKNGEDAVIRLSNNGGNENIQVAIYSISGQLMRKTTQNLANSQVILSTYGLPNGLYVIEVKHGSKTETVRVLIE